MEALNKSKRLEQILGLIALFLLLIGCFLVLKPFVSAVLWAIVLCFSIWPLYRRLLKLLKNRRTLAALVMTLGMTTVLLLPFAIVGISMAEDAKELANATRKWFEAGPPEPPAWLARVPWVGEKATVYWKDMTQDSAKLKESLKRITEKENFKKLLERVSTVTLNAGLKLGAGVLELAFSIFIAFFLFRDGTAAADRLQGAVAKIAGGRGAHLLEVAGNTVRGVVYGIIGTALVQGVVAGIGFIIAGIPGAVVLALLTFFLSVVPMGPPLIWIPAVIWLFNQGRPGWGIFMIVWGIIVSTVDNVVKPLIISQGSKMPFVLIFFGVLGGAVAFGLIGVFLGPTLLAVSYRLMEEWSPASAAPPAEGSPDHKPPASPDPAPAG